MLSTYCVSDMALGTCLILKLHNNVKVSIIIPFPGEESAAQRSSDLPRLPKPREVVGSDQAGLSGSKACALSFIEVHEVGEWTQTALLSVGFWLSPPCPKLIGTMFMLFPCPQKEKCETKQELMCRK